MRFKHMWSYIPLPKYAKTFWERITFSRLTLIYLGFSILHFLVQLALQTHAFTINDHAFKVGGNLLARYGKAVNTGGLPFYSNSTLQICQWVPSSLSVQDGRCQVIWPKRDTTLSQQDDTTPYYAAHSPSSSIIPSLTPSLSPSNNVINNIASGPAPVSTQSQITYASNSASTTTDISRVAVISFAHPTANDPAQDPEPSPIDLHPAVASPPITPAGSRIFSTAVPKAATSAISEVARPTVPEVITSTVSVVQVSTPSPAPVTTNDDDNEENDSSDGEEDDDEESDGDDSGGQTISQRDILSSAPSKDIDDVCLQALRYPLSILGNTKREDIVFIAFQFWVLGMSIVALLNESIPHIFASLLTHVMATAWGGFQLWHTAYFRSQFTTLITKGACSGVGSVLPINSAYWESRRAAEVSSLAFNALALVVSTVLSWRLFKLFGWQTFKRVGASRVINRVYKLVLVLSITIQISLFFMAVTVSLWLDRLINSVIGDLAALRKLYATSSIITLILLVPWLMMGWFGVRRERKIPVLIFLLFCVGYLGGWGVMFISTTFRWTFITWTFFSIMASISVALTIACLVLGLLCRMNFGKGLVHYLNPQDDPSNADFGIVTPGYGDAEAYDDEKVEFPSTEKPMPTFNAAYRIKFPVLGHMANGSDPRFYNQQFDASMPPRALTRNLSDKSASSSSSTKSSSWESYYGYSHSPSNSLQNGQSKRWIIE